MDLDRWFLFGAVLALGVLSGLGALLLWPVTTPTDAPLPAYEKLWAAVESEPADIAVLEGLSTRQDGLAWHAAMSAGEAHAEDGAPLKAARMFERAVELWPTVSARRGLAKALENAGQGEAALEHWKLLLPSDNAAQAVLRLEEDKLQAAQLLNLSGAHGHALEASAALDTPPATLESARALAGLGRLTEAEHAFRAYLNAVPHDGQAHAEHGRVLERQGHRDRAVEAYLAAGPAGGLAAGRLLEEDGRTDVALRAYARSDDPEAMWRRAVLLEQEGQEGEALSLYTELADGTHRVWDDAALRAYLLLKSRGAHREAESVFQMLPSAAQWLLGKTSLSPLPELRSDPPEVSSPAAHAADALFAHLPDDEAWGWARAELEVALRQATPAERLTIGEWYLARGDYAAACRVGTAVLQEHPCPRALKLVYPRAHWEEVSHHAARNDVDPYLVLAVMREESHFRSRAVSPSDARGLMQLLPSTARWIAEDRLGISFDPDRLFQPDFNIRLGTWYLGYLTGQFPGGTAWAIAAYNGGQGNIRRWTGGEAALHDLPAALRSVEPREYLTKVLASWLIYRELYEL